MTFELHFKTRYDLNSVDQKYFESLVIEIIRQTGKNIIIGIVCRPSNLNAIL